MSKWCPDVIHISYGFGDALCGAKSKTWPEHCMSNEWAKQLPQCPECLGVSVSKTVEKVPVKREETQVMRVYLKDYLTI